METHAKQVEALGPTPILGSNRFKIWSDVVGAHFIVDVSEPPVFVPRTGPLPVLFVTDGNLCFPTAAQLSGALAMEPDGPPPMLVVGIGYEVSGGGKGAEHHVIRIRDLSPVEDKRFEAMMRKAPPPLTWRDDIRPGGAKDFRRFILDELVPWLAERFDIDDTDLSLTGVSLGGLFVLDTLLSEPRAFKRYVAVSPAIWWADRYILNRLVEHSEALNEVEGHLYMAVGELEEAQDPFARMVSNLKDFATAFPKSPGVRFRLSHEILPGETHMSAFGPSFSRAVRTVFTAQSRNEDWTLLEE